MNYPYVSADDERMIRDTLDERVVRSMEAVGLDLSDGDKDITMNTDRLIRLVETIARFEVVRIEKALQEKFYLDEWGVPYIYVAGFLERMES